jgi:hypothetical protein
MGFGSGWRQMKIVSSDGELCAMQGGSYFSVILCCSVLLC